MKALDDLTAGLWTLKLSSPCSYSTDHLLRRMIRLQIDHLPQAMPLRWDNYEPLGNAFDPQTFESLIPDQVHPGAVLWARNRQPKAEGIWMAGVAPNFPNPHAIPHHGSLTVSCVDFGLQEQTTQLMKYSAIALPCDIGTLEALSPSHSVYARQSQSIAGRYGFNTHTLRHWLPDMLWGMLFGPPYVRMFGLQKLLSAPAHTVVQLGPESVYMQLTEDLRDNELRFEHLQAKRMEVKIHLGLEHFWQADKAYDRMEHPENAGKVFKVPVFELWPDPPMEVGQKLQTLFQKIRV